LELAADQARRAGNGQVGPEHLLQGMLAQPDGAGVDILESLGVDLVLLRRRLGATGGPGGRSGRDD
jgi:ATP-dependent Clp protease ATP-binding subunit ClpA